MYKTLSAIVLASSSERVPSGKILLKISDTPPTLKAKVGVPNVRASSTVLPKDSGFRDRQSTILENARISFISILFPVNVILESKPAFLILPFNSL